MKSVIIPVVVLAAVVTICGCKRKTPEAQAPVPPPDTSASTASTPDAATANPAPAPVPVVVSDAQSGLANVNQALKGRDYVKAADTLLAVQRQPLNDQQAEAARMQMRQLQSAVAAGVAAGDPVAKAAADRLRASASGR